MSRIGKSPIEVPEKVEVSIRKAADGTTITVKGPLGELTRTFRPEVDFSQEGQIITVTIKRNDRNSRSLHGLSRTLLNNMIVGVNTGFEKNLEINGVGYRAAVQGKVLNLSLGFSHPVDIDIPEGIEIKVDNNTKLSVKGYDKQAVGDLSALIRSKRPPEPYKGKGVKYADEKIRRKAGKAG